MFESCAAVSSLFTIHCLSSLSCVNEYLVYILVAIGVGIDFVHLLQHG